MKNPCRECLLINNCTAICEDKENFRTLLREALKRNGLWNWVNRTRANDPQIKLYRTWMAYKAENDADILRITARAEKLKAGTLSHSGS